MYFFDYKLDPPDEPQPIGVCMGCGDEILDDEQYIILGECMIHEDASCALMYCQKAGAA